MAEQMALPLEFTDKPVQVVVKVDDQTYRFGPFPTEAEAASMIATLSRLVCEQVGANLSLSHGSWFGTSINEDGAGRMWSIFPSQQY